MKNTSINRSINQSINQSISQSVNQFCNQSISTNISRAGALHALHGADNVRFFGSHMKLFGFSPCSLLKVRTSSDRLRLSENE